MTVSALARSYLTHEAGHIREVLNRDTYLDPAIHFAGINATNWSTQRMLWEPDLRSTGDLNEIIQSMDLGFYLVAQEPFIAGVLGRQDGGDTQQYLRFRTQKSVAGIEEALISALAVWNLLDSYGPLSRIGHYLQEGKYQARASGEFGLDNLRTFGQLTTEGTLFGLSAHYYLDAGRFLPSGFLARAWMIPIRTAEEPVFPFGVELEAAHIFLVNFSESSLLTGSAEMGLSVQNTESGGVKALLSGGAGIALENPDWAIGLHFHYLPKNYVARQTDPWGVKGSMDFTLHFEDLPFLSPMDR
jgi:hypothetical protein